jgi:hypothetical protein
VEADDVADVLSGHFRVAWNRLHAKELTVDGRRVGPETVRDLALNEPQTAVAVVGHLERMLMAASAAT